jgi:transposase
MKKNLGFLGLDIAQDSAHVELLDGSGAHLWRGSMAARKQALEELGEMLQAHGIAWADLVVLMEASGTYHLHWAQAFEKRGARVYAINPLLTARVQSLPNAIRENKTDVLDADKCAHLAHEHLGELERFRYRPDACIQGFKQLQSTRQALRHALTNLRKSYRSHLELVFPALLRAALDPYSRAVSELLALAPSAGAWLALPSAQQQHLLDARQADALTQACRESLADESLAQACAPAMLQALRTDESLQERLEQLDKAIEEQAAARPRVKLLRTIPGMGAKTSAVLEAYLPDTLASWGSRPKQVAKLQALFGCDPRRRSSGKWVGQTRLSKRGIIAARVALWQSSFCALTHEPTMRAYYDALRQRGKPHKLAMIDLMRKQLRRIVAVLNSNQRFILIPDQTAA